MIKRKSHNLDEELLLRARRILGTTTETEAIHEALRAVLVGDRIVGDLRAAGRPGIFRSNFVREMRRESKRS
jgi:Arc/MetJ family transcription regulator